MSKITENQIRDYLVEHLYLVDPSLKFLSKEFYLPNATGAAGFLDIFARDSNGKLVIIEIKRTDAAAREAIQELYKYVSLIRKRQLVKDTEIRLILLSVQWHELSAPFSELCKSAPFEITAGKIILGDTGIPVAVTPVSPITTSTERKIGIRHFLWGFPDKSAADIAIKKIAKIIKNSGLEDFLLIQSRATRHKLGGRSFIYFAQRELHLEEYLKIIEKNSNEKDFSEFKKQLESYTELDDKVAEASDQTWLGTNGFSFRDFGADTGEISGPEKGRHWFENGTQVDIQIHRFGRFNDEWLEDATIIREICGEGGVSTVNFSFVANNYSPPEMKALSEGVDNVFFFNQTWQSTVHQLIHYAQQKTGNVKIIIQAFSSDDILRSITGLAFGYPHYIPCFTFDIKNNGKLENFVGFPEWDGKKPDFEKIIEDHFFGNIMGYFTACHFGENRTLNHDVMSDLGVHYTVSQKIDGHLQRIRIQGSSILQNKKSFRSLHHLVKEHKEEISSFAKKFLTIDNGLAEIVIKHIIHAEAEHDLSKITKNEPRPRSELYWNGDIHKCDLCEYSFESLEFMVDAIFKNGFGTNVCAYCFLKEGRGIGTGLGQIYKKTSQGWLHIAG